MAGRHAADAEQRHRDRDVGVFGEAAHEIRRARGDDAVAGEDERTFRLVDEVHRTREFGLPGREVRPLMGHRRVFGPFEVARLLLTVFRHVDEHRAGPARSRDMEGLAHGGGDVLGVGQQVVVLGDGQRDARDVAFLEGVGADQLAAHLPGDADDGRGIHHRRRDTGHEVGGAGAGGGNRHADLPGRPGVTVGHVGGALFVAHQHVPDRVVEHRVVGGKDGSARVAEDAGHAFAHQRFPEDLRAGQSS